jgi:hypothetical protein
VSDALGATNQLYGELDDKHATVFHTLLGDRGPDGSGLWLHRTGKTFHAVVPLRRRGR